MAFLGQVLVFSITGCPFCAKTKRLLTDLQVPYADINLEKYPDRRYEMQSRTGRRTVPQIFFNAKHIGGFEDIKKLYDDGKLEDLLKEVAEAETPADAPMAPPPMTEEEVELTDANLLPSQRDNASEECAGCTPDELAAIVRELRDHSGLIGAHSHHLISYRNSFIGKDLVTWLVKYKGCTTRDEAVALGNELFKHHFFHHVTFDHEFKDEKLFYRLLGDGYSRALNSQLSYACIPRPAIDVAQDLRKYILEIYDDYLSSGGFGVDYRGISRSKKFEVYVRATAELKRVDLTSLSREEKIALFINVYNALVIHAFVVQGPPNTLWKRYKFFNSVSYIIGGRVFTLNDIENGVLRSNRKPVGVFKKPFSSHDPRLKIALEHPEPRVHFALVCGAKSCPPIKTYSPDNIEEELNLAMESFLEGDACRVDLEKKEIHLTSILKWYKIDFGNNNQEVMLAIIGFVYW